MEHAEKMNQDTEYGLGKPMHLPCGGVAYFDPDSGISYRCETCFAVAGSVGQPKSCREAAAKYDVLKQLGSNVKWDYNKGCEVTE
jgi:hypothetical protein